MHSPRFLVGLCSIFAACVLFTSERAAHAQCRIEVFSHPAFSNPLWVHDAARVTWDGHTVLLNMQTPNGGLLALGQTTYNGDSPADYADIISGSASYRKTESFSDLEAWQCQRCVDEYLKSIGYPYVGGDSNHAMARCTTAAGLGKLPYDQNWGCAIGNHGVQCQKGSRVGQDNADPETRSYGSNDPPTEPYPQPCQPQTSCQAQGKTCGSIYDGCTVVTCGPSCPSCTPTTSCEAQGAACGSIYNGCFEEECLPGCPAGWTCGQDNDPAFKNRCFCYDSQVNHPCGQHWQSQCDGEWHCTDCDPSDCYDSCTGQPTYYPGCDCQYDSTACGCANEDPCACRGECGGGPNCSADLTQCGCPYEDLCACYGQCGSSCDATPWCMQCWGLPPASGYGFPGFGYYLYYNGGPL